jgi:hypothetical protein
MREVIHDIGRQRDGNKHRVESVVLLSWVILYNRKKWGRSYIDAELTLGPSTAVPSLRLPSSYAFMALMVASKVNVISPGRDSNDETEPEDH